MVYDRLGLEPDSDLIRIVQGKTDLLPPEQTPVIDRNEMIKRIRASKRFSDETEPRKKATGKVDLEVWERIMDLRATQADYDSWFGYRTKTDIQIKRTSLIVLQRLYRGKTIVWRRAMQLMNQLDSIHVSNLLYAVHIHGVEWMEFWARLNAYRSLESWLYVSYEVNIIVKKYRVSMLDRIQLAEASMVGYRNPPMPGFDMLKESTALAEGGDEHGWTNWEHEFRDIARSVMAGHTADYCKYMGLDDWIKSGKAATSGASSYGKVHYEIEGEKGKFKARKNFMTDVVPVDELISKTRAALGVGVCKAMVKAELGKMRIAVGGDIWTYYSMSWLAYLSNHVQVKWSNNTLEENVNVQMGRQETMLNQLKENYSLPFDYAGFDHQPTTWECQIMADEFFSAGMVNVPEEYRDEWEYIKNECVKNLDNTNMVVNTEGQEYVVRVTGGLQSGIAITSLIGNFWNQIMTRAAKIRMQKLNVPLIAEYIRGDDSSIICKSYCAALLMRLAYASINAIGKDVKYGIHYEETEFLRIWYSEDRCWGYPNRAIPGLSQRKPWANEPWSFEANTANIFACLRTLERRLGYQLKDLEQVFAEDWSKHRGLSTSWLRLPVALGGFGLMSFRGKIPSERLPKVELPTVVFGVARGSYEQYQFRYADFNLTVGEACELQQLEMTSKAGADDVRGIVAKYRRKVKELYKRIRPTWSDIGLFRVPSVAVSKVVEQLATQEQKEETIKLVTPPAFGSARSVQAYWTTLQDVKKVRDIKPMDIMLERHPLFVHDLKKLESKGMHRTAAIDYLFGKLSGLSYDNMHPMASDIVQAGVANIVAGTMQGAKMSQLSWVSAVVGGTAMVVNSVRRSKYYERLFRW